MEIHVHSHVGGKDWVMALPLMPGYDHINVVRNLDPVSAMRD